MLPRVFVCLLFICVTLWSLAFANGLTYTIDVLKDTILIGEPIIVKCELKNSSSQATEIFIHGSSDLLCYDQVRFSLHISPSEREYLYRVNWHYSPGNLVPKFVLQPNELISFYIIMCWSGWSFRADSIYDHLTYDELKNGIYRIESKYFLPREPAVSNQDSFYAISMPDNENKIFEEIGYLIDRYFSWPEGVLREDRSKILELFPPYIEDGSIIAPYCHYILCEISFSKGPEAQKALTFVDDFLKKYPGTPLAEKLEFDLYLYYIRQDKPEEARAAILDALQKYPDNLDGYIYLRMTSKRGD